MSINYANNYNDDKYIYDNEITITSISINVTEALVDL